jgi:hypothetical protein
VYTTENALTFADMAKAVQRSAGLGQVTCPDGSMAPDALSCLPVQTPAETAPVNALFSAESAAGEQPYYQTVLGMQIPTSTLLIGGIIAAIALGAAFFGGARR